MAQNLPIIAVDEGSSRVKLSYFSNTGKLVTHVSTSVVQSGKLMTSDLEYDKAAFILDTGKAITVKDNAMSEQSNVVASLYQFGDANLGAVHQALIEAGFGGHEVEIVVTLPVDLYFNPVGSSTVVNTENIQRKKANLMRKITPVREDSVQCAIIKNVKVCPEAVTAFNLLRGMDTDGNRVEVDPYDSFAIFDFGESTLDVTVLMGNGEITESRFSSDLAVSKVIKLLRNKISRAEDIDIPHARGSQILRAGKFRGESVQHLIDGAVSTVFEDIRYKVLEELPKLRGLAGVYVIGGGASLFAEKLKEIHPRVVVPSEPDTTLSRSMLKVAKAKPINFDIQLSI